MDGWIKLYRKMQENFLWTEKRKFSKFEAFIDILLSANHKEKEVTIGFNILEIKAGSFLTSEVKLSQKWGWDRKTVRRFLQLLEVQKMATTEHTTKYTIITLTNWDVYQFKEQQNGQQEEHQEHNKGTSKEHQKHTNKNIKNIKIYKNNKKYKKIKDKKSYIQKKYIEKIGGTNLANIYDCISYLKKINFLLIEEALNRTSKINNPNWRYCKAILDNWEKQKIYNLVDLKDFEKKFTKNKAETEDEQEARIAKALERKTDDIF